MEDLRIVKVGWCGFCRIAVVETTEGIGCFCTVIVDDRPYPAFWMLDDRPVEEPCECQECTDAADLSTRWRG